MRALRVERPSGRAHVVHWLAAGGEWTICGLRVAVLLKPEQLDLSSLPIDEGCEVCPEMLRTERTRRTSSRTAEPAPGRLRKTGPLYHGVGKDHRTGQIIVFADDD